MLMINARRLLSPPLHTTPRPLEKAANGTPFWPLLKRVNALRDSEPHGVNRANSTLN
jgi:hypothetical protein